MNSQKKLPPMTKKQLDDRNDLLMDVQAWIREENHPYLTPLQLVCVTQERVAIMHGLDQLREDCDRLITLEYKIPDHLENKVQRVVYEISQSNWTRAKEYLYNETNKKYERVPDYITAKS